MQLFIPIIINIGMNNGHRQVNVRQYIKELQIVIKFAIDAG